MAAELGPALANVVIEQVEVATKYAGYIVKQVDDVERALREASDLLRGVLAGETFEDRADLRVRGSRKRAREAGGAAQVLAQAQAEHRSGKLAAQGTVETQRSPK